jgi:probable HAF family extracellular repeat protein
MRYRAVVGLLALAGCSGSTDADPRPITAEVIAGIVGTSPSATAVNRTGQVAGQRRVGGVPRAFRWSGGSSTDLLPPSGNPADSTRVASMNDAGWVVGNTTMGTFSDATLWRPGQAALLLETLSTARRTTARAINNHDEVVGYYLRDGGFSAFGWSAATGMVELPVCSPAFSSRFAMGVSDAGSVVGYCSTPAPHAYVWTAAGGTTLLPEGSTSRSLALAVNDDGWVVGFVEDAAGQHAALWKPGTGGYQLHLLEMPAGLLGSSVANAINEDGVVAGTGGSRALRWTDSTLPGEALPLPDGATTSTASGINPDGVIVGFARGADANAGQAVRWVP